MSMRLAGSSSPSRQTYVSGAVNLATQIANTQRLINAAATSGNTKQEARLRTQLEELQSQQGSGVASSFRGA